VRNNRVKRVGALIAVVLIWTATAFAQGTTSSVSGTVVDAAGGAIPGAAVIVSNESGASFESVTNGEGVFNVPALARSWTCRCCRERRRQ
jgi:hypothetical protein